MKYHSIDYRHVATHGKQERVDRYALKAETGR